MTAGTLTPSDARSAEVTGPYKQCEIGLGGGGTGGLTCSFGGLSSSQIRPGQCLRRESKRANG